MVSPLHYYGTQIPFPLETTTHNQIYSKKNCNKLTVNNLQIISTNTKEVLRDRSFEDVELNTLITVFSLDHLNVDSELDLFHAVARYAKAGQKMEEERDGGPPPEKLFKSLQPSEKKVCYIGYIHNDDLFGAKG